MLASAGVSLEPLQILPATAMGIAYAVRAHRLQRTPRAVPTWRQWCFHSGLLLIVLTLASPIGQLADELFAVHMAEHLILADGGALLLVLGLTGPVLAPVLRIRILDVLRVLSHPAIALPLWAADLALWHVAYFHDAAVRHAGTHALQHLCFVTFGANMWMPLFGPLPQPAWFGNAAKLGYIIGVRLAGSILANVFLFAGGAFFSVYAVGEAKHGITPADDQVAAGTVMMVWESLLTICLFGWLFL
jgi:cytochrome c oxidase assembly factor CtaG